MRAKLKFLGEVLGLSPIKLRFQQALIALKGAKDIPKAQFGLSSLKLLNPRVAFPLWLGKDFLFQKVIITNLFNHTQTPIEKGWSVKKTQVRDFRGKKLTYNSHNGTDFAVPIGTTLLLSDPLYTLDSF